MNLRAALAIAVLGASFSLARPASAQTFPVRNPVLERIWAIGMDSSRLEGLATVLLDSIGPRLNGTPNLRTAQDWLVRTYASWGIEAKNEQYGTWRGWRRGHSHVDLISPRVRTLDATMIGYSPGTDGRDVVAEAIVLPRFADSTEFVRWLPQARGKLVLVSAPPATCRPLDDFRQFGSDESRRRIDSLRLALLRDWSTANVRGTGYSLALGGGPLGMRLEEAGVAGLLTTRPKDALGAREIFETHNTRAPALSLSCEDYGLVFRLAERGSAPRLRLNLDSQSFGEQPAFNTIATIPGTGKPGEYVLLSAHFDSWDGASGATDNGTGSLIMLEAMRILKRVYPRPVRTIRVGHWTGEETGVIGSRAYREDHPEVEKGLQAVFNSDNGTGRVVRMGAMGLPNGAEHLRQWLDKLPTELRSQISFTGIGTPGGGGTDDFSFYCAGAPTFGLGGLNWNYNQSTWHTNLDSFDKIVFEDLRSNATLVAMLAYLASEDPTLVTRERLDLSAAADSALRAYGANPNGVGPRPNPRREWPLCQLAPRNTTPRF
jgi:hypothetical protein